MWITTLWTTVRLNVLHFTKTVFFNFYSAQTHIIVRSSSYLSSSSAYWLLQAIKTMMSPPCTPDWKEAPTSVLVPRVMLSLVMCFDVCLRAAGRCLLIRNTCSAGRAKVIGNTSGSTHRKNISGYWLLHYYFGSKGVCVFFLAWLRWCF